MKKGYDFCIVARCFTVNAPHEKVVQDFRTSVKKLGVWKDEEDID